MSATCDAERVHDRLARAAASQHGVFSREDALACGVLPRTIDRRVASGVWQRLYPGVYRLAGAPATWRGSLLAACMAWGEGAVVSHRAAAALWELPGFAPGSIELSVPRGRKRTHRHVVHHRASLPRADVTRLDAIPVTSVARTLVDLAACVPADMLEEALDDALRRRLVTLPRVRASARARRGRPGSVALEKLLAARAGGSRIPQSVFETRLLRVLRRAGLPMPAIQHEVRTRRGPAILDLAYIDRRIAVEADGYRWHSGRRRWERDRARDNELATLGWTVIHVTWTELRDRPQDVVATIAAVLGGKRPAETTTRARRRW